MITYTCSLTVTYIYETVKKDSLSSLFSQKYKDLILLMREKI